MNTREREQIRRETGFSLNVITKWDKGQPVSHSSDLNITTAAQKLGLTDKRMAPEQKTEGQQ